MIELGCEDVNVTKLPDVTVENQQLRKMLDIVNTSKQISTGLMRHGIIPESYFEKEKDGKFPISRIIVRENDGTISEFYALSDEQESTFIKESRERLKSALSSNSDEADVAAKIDSQIDTTRIYESKACESLAVQLVESGLPTNALFADAEPIFKVICTDKKEVYLNSLSALFEYIKKTGRQGLHIQRYKGLGEMNAEQLWETTMEPTARKMIKVTMEDAYQAERIFSLLMGDDVEPRREYIEKYAAGVKDLDI